MPQAPYVPPGGWKEQPTIIKEKTLYERINEIKQEHNHTISKFKPKELLWNKGQYISKELRATLYPDYPIDTSGRRIFNLGRDFRNPGKAPWYPTTVLSRTNRTLGDIFEQK